MIATVLVLIVFGAIIAMIAVPIVRTMRLRAMEAELLANPPEVLHFKVRVPADTDKSNQKMVRAWERLHGALEQVATEEAIRSNSNVIHAAIVGEGTGPGKQAKVTFVVSCPPHLADRCQLEIVECYAGDAEVVEMKPGDFVLQAYADSVRAYAAWEAETERLAREAEAAAEEQRRLAERAEGDDVLAADSVVVDEAPSVEPSATPAPAGRPRPPAL